MMDYNYTNQNEVKKQKKGWTGAKITALALCCSLMGGAVGAGGTVLGSAALMKLQGQAEGGSVSTMLEGVRDAAVLDVNHIDTNREMTPAEVYAANVNSTVGIVTSVTTNFWGYTSTSRVCHFISL